MEAKVAVKDLRIGMFVADLDRPWIDTPFLLQGFLIEDEQQIRQLQRHCHYVVIDRARSTGDEFESPSRPAPAPASAPDEPRIIVTSAQEPARRASSPPRPVPARPPAPAAGARNGRPHDPAAGGKAGGAAPPAVEIVVPPRENGRMALPGGFLHDLASRFQGLWKRRPRALPAEPVEEPSPPPRPSVLPASVQVTIYEDARTVEEEIAPARKAYERTSELLRNLASDVWAGHPVEIESVEEVVDEMVESMVRNPDALMWVARLREQDLATYGHGLMVAVYLVAFGRHLGFPRAQLAQLGTIGLLLDIGKIRLPRELLEKQGRLTSSEYETIKTHVTHGLEILEATPDWPAEVLEGIGQHHERMNGSGYPRGLKGDEIAIFGRMAGIADCFAALTKSRPYAEAVSSYQALRSISSWGGDYFHEPLTEQFVQAVGVFPVGSLVELSSGEVAVVVSHNKVRRLKPRVLLLTNPDKTPSAYPAMADLLYDPKLGGEAPAFIRRSLPAGAYGLDPREHYLS